MRPVVGGALLLACAVPACADDSDWRTLSDATLYAYASRTVLRSDSVLNPENQVARLPQASEAIELRVGFRAEHETVRITGRFIGAMREMRNGYGKSNQGEAYASLWQIRVRAAESWHVAAGRDVLNWGAGQFRSPSSPFYFDNGRTDPMRELVGMDVAKVSWTPDRQNSTTFAYVVRSGYHLAQPDVWRSSWLAKFDRRGDEAAWGAVVVRPPHLGAFYGAHGQYTMSDELMLYGEWGSSVLPVVLGSPADVTQPYFIQSPSLRRNALLAGCSYTLENGQSLMLEYLHDGHGYSRAEEAAYFQRATTQLGLPLGRMPRLLGRDYFHAVWQANMMSETGYWRLMYTHNLTDGGSEFAVYGETALHKHLSLYGLAVLPRGHARQEAGMLFVSSFTIGIKSVI